MLDKGGGQIENTVLFGKYQLIRTLGQGQTGTVYLAFHQELREYRAVKQVAKSSADYEQFKKEALLLTSLSHEGIPIVYDLEEDSCCSYLIEEYLEGDCTQQDQPLYCIWIYNQEICYFVMVM